jgi:hypothetical protein
MLENQIVKRKIMIKYGDTYNRVSLIFNKYKNVF